MKEPMTDDEVKRTRNDLEMMRRPHLWPGTLLPLKSGGRVAVLACTHVGSIQQQYYAVLRDQNMYGPPPEDDAEWEGGGDELLLKLIEEGWIVD